MLSWYVTSHPGLPSAEWEMSTDQNTVTLRCGWEFKADMVVSTCELYLWVAG